MTEDRAWKRFLKAGRVWPPLNAPLTTGLRGALRMAGRTPDWVVRHVHRVGDVVAPLPNGRSLKLWSRGDDWVSNQVFWKGWAGYEPETAPLFFRLASRSRLTIDVGAYVGYFTLLAAHATLDGRVIAFEPMAEPHARLRHNVALNELRNVECELAAVGAAGGEATLFHVPTEMPTSSSLSLPFMSASGPLEGLRVRVAALDAFLDERGLGPVDLVKVDTESTEPDVLRGMRDTLARDRPDVICEVLAGRGAEAPLMEILTPLDYRFFLLTPDGPVERNGIEGHPTFLNYLFSARERSPT